MVIGEGNKREKRHKACDRSFDQRGALTEILSLRNA
jgi:hypothetical protein